MVGLSTSEASGGGRRRLPNLADDDLSHLGELLDLLDNQSFTVGQLIFAEGDPGDRVYVIRSGVVKVTHRGPGGRHNLIALAGPGDIVGEVAVFDPGPRAGTALAVDAVDAGWLGRAAFRCWLATQPSAGVAVLQLLARQVKRRHDQLAEHRVQDVDVRIARQLLHLAERFGRDQPNGRTSLPHLTHDELGDLVGATAPQVALAVADLVASDAVRFTDSAVIVCDPRAVSRVAVRIAQD